MLSLKSIASILTTSCLSSFTACRKVQQIESYKGIRGTEKGVYIASGPAYRSVVAVCSGGSPIYLLMFSVLLANLDFSLIPALRIRLRYLELAGSLSLSPLRRECGRSQTLWFIRKSRKRQFYVSSRCTVQTESLDSKADTKDALRVVYCLPDTTTPVSAAAADAESDVQSSP